ncbi:2-phosphoglycerate kinase [Candidatus Gracilibacteria bacterium]|nr:2-phosphoglycerate kinase [Candidatus Gracilibacteria bacterium]
MKKHVPISVSDLTQPYYSSDLLARSLVRTGIPRYKAYQITHNIWEEMGQDKKDEKTLKKKVLTLLKSKYPDLVSRHQQWQKIMQRTKPVIILIGGGTGIGTSTLAVRLGWLLEINQILGTDSVREVVRRFLPAEIEPLLNVSTYETGNHVKLVKSHEDGVIYGFLSQSKKVIYGVEAIVKRAIKEETSIVIEGVHLIPGEMDFLKKYKSKATIIQVLLDVNQPETHRQHFFTRQLQNANRAKTKYLKYFKEIRLIRDFLVAQAQKNDVPIIENYSLNQAEKEVLEKIYQLSLPQK